MYTSREKCRFVRLVRIEPTLGAIFRFESREERRDEGGKGGGEEGQGKDCGNRASDAALVEGRPENLRPGILLGYSEAAGQFPRLYESRAPGRSRIATDPLFTIC